MNKVALKEIGFVEQNEVDDTWTQQTAQQEQQAQRSIAQEAVLVGGHWFKSIDQQQATMAEELTMDAEGSRYRQQVKFAVRTEYDRTLAKKYERRPLVLHVWTVDGNLYKIGTKQYPAYMTTSRTNGMDAVETAVTVEYETLTAIM